MCSTCGKVASLIDSQAICYQCHSNENVIKVVAEQELEHQLRCPLHGKYQYFRKTIHSGHICNHQEPSTYPAEENPICGMKAEMDVPWKEKE